MASYKRRAQAAEDDSYGYAPRSPPMSARLSPDYTRGGSGMRGDSYRPGADRSASPYSSRHPDRDAYDRYERERDPLDHSRGDRYPAVDEYGRSRDRYAGGEDRYGSSRHDRHDRREDHDYYYDRAQEADREREYERTGRRGGGGRGEDQGPIPDPLDAPSVLPFKQFAQVHRKRQARLDPSAPTSNLTTQEMFDLYKRYKLVYGARSARRFWEEKKKVAFFKEKYSVAEADVERRKDRRRTGRMGKKRVWLQELRDGQLDNASAQMHFASSKAPPGDEEASMNTVWSRTGEPIKVGADNSLPVDPSPQQLLIMRIPPNLPRRAIEEELKTNCPGFLYLAIGEAHANKQYFAIAWANFDSAENAEAARAKMVDNPIFTDNRLQLDVAARGAMVKFRTAPSGSGSLRRLAKDLKQARDVIRWVEKEDQQLWPEGGDLDDEDKAAIFTPASAEITKRVFEDLGLRRYFETGGDAAEDEDEVLLQLHDGVQRFDTPEEADLVRVSIEKTLDLHLDLLREVYFCDYYSSTICDFPEELDRRARGHFRRVYPNGEMEPEREGRDNGEDGSNLGLEQWADNLDRKNALLVGNANIDIEEHGGVDLDKLCLELATPFTRQDDREKHRCIVDVPNPAAEGTTKTCDKLFKALIFVQKHVCNKHRGLIEQELGEGRREDILYLNNYVRDPTRVMPPLQSSVENGRAGGGRGQDMGGLMRMGTISSHDRPYDYDAGPRRRRGDSRRRSQSPPPRNGRLSERFNGGGLSDRLGAMPNNNPPPIHLGGDRPLMFSSSTDPTSAGPPLHLRIGGQMIPSLASFGPLTTPLSALGGSAGSPVAIEPLPPAPRPLDPRAARGQTRSYQDLDTGSGGKEEEVMDLEY